MLMEKASEEKKQELVKLSEISLTLESFEDIFSSFDSRPYSQKLLSDDFIIEARKVVKETPKGDIELNLLLPADKRNANNENIIKKRIKDYFKKVYDSAKKDQDDIVARGKKFAFSGITLMFLATFILFYYPSTFYFTFLVVLMEPGGWFLFWEGLNLVIFESKKKGQDIGFFRKMAHGKINFHSY